MKREIAILGGGAWGTALALHLSRLDQHINMWEFDEERILSMQRERCNRYFMKDQLFNDNIDLFADITQAVKDVLDIIIVLPSNAYSITLEKLKDHLTPQARIAIATKGIDAKSGKLLHQVTEDILGKRSISVIGGPSFASEVALSKPTSIVIAGNDEKFIDDLASYFQVNHFQIHKSKDMIGVQIGGALKNVVAIAVGMSSGFGYGMNSISSLITRGLWEICDLGVALKANLETLFGLAGLGDLILTCSDNQSRNRQFGCLLAQTGNLERARKEISQTVEGIENALYIREIASKMNIKMLICENVARVCNNEITPFEAIKNILFS